MNTGDVMVSRKDITKIKAEIEGLLSSSLIEVTDRLNKDANKGSIYAVVVYCDSGYVSLGLGINTEDWLKAKIDDAPYPDDEYYKLNAAEWKELNYSYNSFERLNKRVTDVLDEFYEYDLSREEIDAFFVEVIANSILKAEIRQRIQTKNAKGLLLGMQFGDPTDEDWSNTLEVSRRVNDAEWHQSMSQFKR